jgi:transposase-like protein
MKERTQNSLAQQGQLARRKYDDEFKQQALAMVRNGQSVRSVAEALGISENLLHQWKRAARANQLSLFSHTYRHPVLTVGLQLLTPPLR